MTHTLLGKQNGSASNHPLAIPKANRWAQEEGLLWEKNGEPGSDLPGPTSDSLHRTLLFNNTFQIRYSPTPLILNSEMQKAMGKERLSYLQCKFSWQKKPDLNMHDYRLFSELPLGMLSNR
jgi:hypothetical protein